jgi:hypothetical protein
MIHRNKNQNKRSNERNSEFLLNLNYQFSNWMMREERERERERERESDKGIEFPRGKEKTMGTEQFHFRATSKILQKLPNSLSLSLSLSHTHTHTLFLTQSHTNTHIFRLTVFFLSLQYSLQFFTKNIVSFHFLFFPYQ